MKPDRVLRAIERDARRRGLPIIGPERGSFLDEVVTKHKPNRVLEIGTLVGYSAIRMGRLLQDGGRVTCVDIDPSTADSAGANIEEAGLSDRIEIMVGDAREVIPKLRGTYDMVFIDAEKSEYLDYLKACEGLLRPGSVVVADNVKVYADRLEGYLHYVRNTGRYASTTREGRLFADPSVIDALEISVKR